MALLDVFKKKKLQERKAKPKAEEKAKRIASSSSPSLSLRESSVKEEIKKSASSADAPERRKIKKKTKIGEGYRVLKTPHITEKATDLTEKNQYVFKIWPRANKVAVKKAIEDVFGVDVVSVKIINTPKKKRRLGRIEGFRKGYKKAIVKIKEGQKIEVLPR